MPGSEPTGRTRRSSQITSPEALVFSVVLQQLEKLAVDVSDAAVRRTLDHAAQAFGFVVVDADAYRAVIDASNGQPRVVRAGALGEGTGEQGGLVG